MTAGVVAKPRRAHYRPTPMGFIRALIREDRLLAATILAMALAMKLFVPAGYMIGESAGADLTITICSGVDEFVSKTVSTPAGSDHGSDHKSPHDSPCAFTALAMAAMAGANAPLLALALAFILLVGLLPASRLVLERPARLHPPSRAPPLIS